MLTCCSLSLGAFGYPRYRRYHRLRNSEICEWDLSPIGEAAIDDVEHIAILYLCYIARGGKSDGTGDRIGDKLDKRMEHEIYK